MAHFTVAQEQKLAAILDIVTTQNLSENFARHTATLGNIQGTAVNRSLVKESLVTLLTGACMNGWKNLANQYPEAFQTAYRQRERFGHAMFTLDDFTELRKLSEQTAPFSSGRTPP